jgi:Common central domain of tyrosinase/Polyphenol oxidase middle domain
MKKVTLLSVILLASIFILVSFSSKNKSNYVIAKSTGNIINCIPPAASPLQNVSAFVAKYEPNTVRVRKNVDLLSTAEINAIKVGIIKMKALPYTNPTSWWYQAAIHGTTLTDNLPSWNTCHRSGEEFFFLAWHRMYVYFFERILRAKSGRADLTVPYWDCQINPVLNAAYRDNSPGNPLYAFRNPTINNGGALPSSIMTAYTTAESFIPYYSFQTSILGPHGSLHTTVNGDMAVVSTAARDPVFWLHHANIDRMWEEWLGKCSGRTNPIDTAFLNKTYVFFDESGNPVSMQGSQVVQMATQLNYKYDVLPSTPTCPGARGIFVNSQVLLRKASAVEIKGQTERTSFVREAPGQLDAFINTRHRTNFNFTSTTAPERLILTFESIKIDQIPQGVVEVYLNLPPGVTPASDSRYFVGLLDLFSAQHDMVHAIRGQEVTNKTELDATKVAQALRLTLEDLRNAEVSFLVRGGTLRGVEVRAEARVTIPHIQFSIAEFRN